MKRITVLSGFPLPVGASSRPLAFLLEDTIGPDLILMKFIPGEQVLYFLCLYQRGTRIN